MAALRAVNHRQPSLSDEPEWRGDFTFAQAADTQFGLISRYIDKLPPDRQDCAKEVHLANRLVSEVNLLRPAPRFLIVCGDMVDAFPARADLADTRQRQLAAFAECFRRLRPDVPLVCVCGNHDIGDQPSVETVGAYRETWGDEYYEFWIGGCQMLVVNSQYYYNSSQVPGERSAMHAWLLARLRHGSPVHRLVFMHIPPFIQDADADADTYFTLPRAERLPLLDALVDAGVAAVFCGHYHRNADNLYRDRLPVVVTSAISAQIGDFRHGYRLVTVSKDAVQHRYVEFPCPVNLPDGACNACGPDGGDDRGDDAKKE